MSEKAGTKASEEAASVHGEVFSNSRASPARKRTTAGKSYRRPAAAMISDRR
jgi:hypothetical protein